MTRAQQITVGIFVFLPMLALAAAIPFAWGWGLNWHDLVIAAVFYWVSGLGVTVGYHRYFTHSSFKAKPGLRVALAIADDTVSGSDDEPVEQHFQANVGGRGLAGAHLVDVAQGPADHEPPISIAHQIFAQLEELLAIEQKPERDATVDQASRIHSGSQHLPSAERPL